MAADNFQALISAELDLSRIDQQLADLQNTPIQLKIEVEGNAAKRLAEAVKRGLKNIDVPDISQQLLDAFNIRNPKIVGQVRRQVNQLTAEMGKSFDGNQIFGARLTDKFDRIFGDLVQTIAQNSSAVKSQMTDFYRSFYDAYKNTMIYISDDMERAMGAAYSSISQSGRITRDPTKGIDLNSIWDEMTTKHPDILDGQLSNAQDQIFAFINAMKQAKAELKSAVNFDDLDLNLQNEIMQDAGNAVSGLAGRIKSELEQSINNATERLKTEILLDVSVNTEKITSDIRQAISQVSAPEHPVDISLNINESELRNRIEAAISGISAEQIPLEIDEDNIRNRIHSAIQNLPLEEILVTIDETELQAEIQRVIGAANADITLNVERNQLENDIRTALNSVDLPVDFRVDEDDLRNQLRAAVAGVDLEVDVRVNVTSFQNNLRDSLRNMPDFDWNLLNRMERLNNLGRDGNDIFSAFGNTMQDAFSAYTLANLMERAVDKVVEAGQKAVETVKELNDINVDLQLATGESKPYVDNLISGYSELADELGSLMQDVSESADGFLRQGRSMEETNQLIADATVLSKIGKLDASESTEIITATINGFQLAAEEAGHLNDALSQIDLHTASDAGSIGKALSNTAAISNAVGLSMERTIAIAATMIDTTQRSGSEVGNAIKSILSRINNIKVGKFVDSETGEALNDTEKVLNSIGITMRDVNGQFMDSETIIDNIAEKWETLDGNTKKAVTTAVAGTRQANFMTSVFDNYGKVIELTELAYNSEGTAMQKFEESYLTSLEAKINALKNSLTELSQSVISDDLYSDFLDTAKAAADVAKEIDLVETAFSGLAAGGAVYALTRIITLLQNTALQVEVLGGGIGGLMRVLAQHPAAIAATAVLGVATAINLFEAEIEKAVESAKQSGEEFAENTSGLEDYAAKVTELRTALDSGTLSEQEAYQVKSDLYDIQMSLTESYGYQAEGIDLVNGELSEQIGLLNELAIAEANRFLNEEARGIAVATDEMEKERNLQLGFYNVKTDEGKALDRIVAKYDDITRNINTNTGLVEITFTGDATQATETLNAFMTDVRNAQDEMDQKDVYWFEDLYAATSEQLSGMNEVLNEYQALYDQAQNAKMIADTKLFAAPEGRKNQTVAKWLSDYAESIEEYNKALALGDTSEIDAAAQAFEEVDAVVQSLMNDADFSEYGDQFADVREQLNEAAISAHEFEKALTEIDAKSAISDFAKTIKEAGITELDFKLGLANPSDDTALCAAISGITWEAERAGISVEGLIAMLTDAGMLSSIAVTEAADATVNAVEDASSSLEDMAENAGAIISNIASVNEALSSQATGQSITADTLTAEGLEEYQDALEYVNGTMQLNAEKVREISEAKAEEQIAINEVTKALKQAEYLKNAAEIDKLRQKIEDNNYAVGESEDSIRGQIEGLLASNDAIVDQCGQLDVLNANLRESVGLYQAWIDGQNVSESGDMFDDTLTALEKINDVLNNEDSDLYGRVGRTDYQTSLDLIIPDSIDKTDEAEINSYLESIYGMFTYDDEGNRTGLNIEEFCQQAVDAGLMVLDEASDSYQIAGGKTMEDFAEGLNLNMPLVQAMFGEMQEFGGEFDWADEAVQTIGDLGVAAVDAAESLRAIETPEPMSITLDVSDIELKEDKIATLNQTIAEMDTLKAQPGISTEQIDQANTVIQYCIAHKQQLEEPAVMNVDTSLVQGKIGEAVTLLQQFQTAQNELEMQAAIGMDTTEAQANVDALLQQIQGLDANVTAALEIDTTSIDTINASLAGMTPELLVKAGIDDTAIIGYSPEQKEATVVYDVDHSKVDLYNPKNLNRTVTYNVVTKGSTPIGGTVSMNGTAHVAGTALASGDWGTKKAETTLVGELGREIVVDPHTGRWFSVGDNGAEFRDIPKGAIVFNHLQTEELLKNGFVAARGTALAGGTANIRGTAMVTGGIKRSQAQKSSVKDSGSKKDLGYDTAKKVTKTIDKTVKKTTKKTEKAIDKILDKLENLFDWVEVKISRLQSKVDLNTTKSENATGYKKKNTYLSEAQDILASMIEMNESGVKQYINQANAIAKKTGLSKKLQKKVQNGTIEIEELSEDDQKKVKQYQKWYDKAQACRQAVEDLKLEQKELAQTKFDNIATEYDNMIGRIEHTGNLLNTAMENQELKGHITSARYYQALINNTKDSQLKLMEKQKDLEASLEDAVASGKIEEGSTEWYEMQGEIDGVIEKIKEADNEILKYQNDIRETNWEIEDMKHEAVTRLTDEGDFLIELLSNNQLFDDKGNITNDGMAVSGLNMMNYEIALDEAKTYADEWKALQKQIKEKEAGGDYDLNLINRANEVRDAWQNASLSVDKYAEAIRDLKDKEFQAQLDALKELSDKYMDVLKKQKDMRDYQDEVSEKTADISRLEKMQLAYSRDTSEEGRLKRQQVDNDLEEARKALEETQYDRFIADQEEILTDLEMQTQEFFEARLLDITSLLAEAGSDANANKDAILASIKTEAGTVSYDITTEIGKIWAADSPIITKIGGATTAITDQGTLIVTAVGGVKTELGKLIGQDGAIPTASGSINTSLGNQSKDFDTTFNNKEGSIYNVLDGIRNKIAEYKKKSDEEGKKGVEESGGNDDPNYDPNQGKNNGNDGKNDGKNNDEGEPVEQGGGVPDDTPKTNQPKSKQGDGKIQVGDKVTFTSGRYYENSYGQGNSGYHNRGKKVYITKIHKGNPYPYHISTGKKLGKGDLGWLKKSQLKGYASGIDKVKEDEWAITQEKGMEIITLPDGSIMTPLRENSGVINHPKTQEILSLANNHDAIMEMMDTTNKLNNSKQMAQIQKTVDDICGISNIYNHSTAPMNVTNNISISLPNVQKPEDFMNWLRNNTRAQHDLQDVVFSEVMGRGKLSTRKK